MDSTDLYIAALCLPVIAVGALVGWLMIRSGRRQEKRFDAEVNRTLQMASTGSSRKPKKQRQYLKFCTNCGSFCLTLPMQDSFGRTYCSAECMRAIADIPLRQTEPSKVDQAQLFCRECLAKTSDKHARAMLTINGTGLQLSRAKDECPQCFSMEKSVYLAIFYVPIVSLGKYRCIHLDKNTFYSRKVI